MWLISYPFSEIEKRVEPETMGMVCIIGSSFFFALNACMVNFIILRGLKLNELCYYRFTIATLLTHFMCKASKKNPYHDDWNHSYYEGVIALPLGDALSLILLSPVLLIMIAPFILGEKIGKKHIMAACTGFMGVIFIMKPSFITSLFGVAPPSEISNGSGNNTRSWGYIICVLSACAYTAESIIMRQGKHVDNLLLTHYFNFYSLAPFAVYMNFEYFSMINWGDVGLFTACACAATIAQSCYSRAFQLGRASVVAPMQYMEILFGYIFDITLLGRSMDFMSIIGSIFITSVAFIIKSSDGH